MNYFVQRGKIRSQVINVPEGLPEILSDITREVLRYQPTTECMCQFIIDYLHSVIVTREKARQAKAVIDRALKKLDVVISDMCICDISKLKAEQLAEAMEDCFKSFLSKRRCELGKEHEIIMFGEFDMLDELIQKCKFNEEEIKISRPVIEAAYQKFVEAYLTAQEDTKGTEALYQYFREKERKRLEDRKQNQAAIIIQAATRGFLVRRSLLLCKKFSLETKEKEKGDFYSDFKRRNEAARKIQRFMRRLLSLSINSENLRNSDDVCQPESTLDIYKKDKITKKEIKTLDKIDENAELISASISEYPPLFISEPTKVAEQAVSKPVAPEPSVIEQAALDIKTEALGDQTLEAQTGNVSEPDKVAEPENEAEADAEAEAEGENQLEAENEGESKNVAETVSEPHVDNEQIDEAENMNEE